MNAAQYAAPWHKQSYDRFLGEQLPELIAERLPLQAYSVTPAGPHTCTVAVTLANAAGSVSLEIEDVPKPDESGLFELDGKRIVVVPAASCEELDKAEVRCAGDYLYDFIEPRLGEAPPDLQWDEPAARSWLPLAEWIREFLGRADVPWVMPLDDHNWLSRCTHLRRIIIDVPRGEQRLGVAGQLGRACPIETPEGPNIGRVLFVARGGEIRDGRIVIVDDSPVSKLGVSASMISLIQHNDTNRALMGANMMRQWLVLDDPEPALVQTGNEPDAPDFWCGRNLLTAFVSWGIGTFEDGVAISESAAGRLGYDGWIEPGDKLSNRHGTKGVIGEILPDDEMPHLPDGTPVELAFSFLGIHTRMNFGQLREAVLGRIAHAEEQPIIVPPFGGPAKDEIRQRLAKAGLPESGMETLLMGKDGPTLERPSTVGYIYWGITDHLVRNKLHATQGGPRQDGRPEGVFLPKGHVPLPKWYQGQRRGEMEYWALRDVGAFENIIEGFNLCSCERKGVETLPEELARGEVEPSPPPAPMFLYLQRRLGAGGIRMEFDGEKVSFARAEPPGEKLVLACAVPHPWMFVPVTEVGALPELPEFQRLAEANEQLRRIMSGSVPESLVARSRENFERCLQEFFKMLLRPEGSDLKGRIVVGGRVSFSGRSVIAPGIDLRIDQVGMPEAMAWALFGPIVKREMNQTEIAGRTERATKTLDEIMARSWVIINRAPTMTETSLLAFHPVRRPERVIRLHPLCCMMMNGDFDGDQVAAFLPVTAAAQQEAGEKLSVAAHLRRDPELLRWLYPPMEALWGLAGLSLSADGRKQIEAVAGEGLVGSGGFVTRDAAIEAMRQLLRREGEEKTLDILERLMHLGFDATKRSGASLNPFAGASLPEAVKPEPLTPDTWIAYADELKDAIVSRTDYDSDDFGPQLLAVKSGARGNDTQLMTGLVGRVVTDEDYRLFFSHRGLIDGVEPDIFFVTTIGARRGLGHVALDCVQMGTERREACTPKGFHVLARAMRSRNAGVVLGRAATHGEVDPLTDVDARLFVGLRP